MVNQTLAAGGAVLRRRARGRGAAAACRRTLRHGRRGARWRARDRAPDELDWDDEIRQAIESRAALSPDALTGMEANLRFGPPETLATRVFGRLSAWQNWIFVRPNAVGPSGALKVYGRPAKFDWERYDWTDRQASVTYASRHFVLAAELSPPLQALKPRSLYS